MRIRSIRYLLAVGAVFGCTASDLFSSYAELGSFSSRVEGQNQALAHLLKNYNSLSINRVYKVRYSNDNARPDEHRDAAIWFNKTQEKLQLEISIPDGPSCSWENVRKDILEQAVKSGNGMLTIDSLTKANQPTNTCLR
jgi:hypothetical protein